MAKRKRESHVPPASQKLPKVKSRDTEGGAAATAPPLPSAKEQQSTTESRTPAGAAAEGAGHVTIHHLDGEAAASSSTTIQIVTGSYERVLHGFTATIPGSLITQPADSAPQDPAQEKQEQPSLAFSDTFLFNAHASSIRCLALSPYIDSPDGNGKVLLATGSTDERINLYQISTRPPAPSSRDKPTLPSLHGTSITENRRNKELGSLLHHDSSVTCLFFPSRGKLMSASEDSQIAITRTRDWVPLSTIKAPIPVPQGRPSGDTAAPGEVPSGINDFSVHPSMKLMVSVSKGEKCMRLWNLLTGKKAGVLTFSREILSAVGEGRFGTGEGRKVEWSADGEQFAVSFERGAVVFGIDCIPTATIVPSPRTKICQMRYLPNSSSVLALSTEDGRIVFYDTKAPVRSTSSTPSPAPLLAQLGGPVAGLTTRIKDFDIIPYSFSPSSSSSSNTTSEITYLLTTGSSDGSVRLWTMPASDLQHAPAADTDPGKEKEKDQGFAAKEVGKLIGAYATGTRITCLRAFVMRGKPLGDDDDDAQGEGRNGKGGDDDDESSSSSGGEESE